MISLFRRTTPEIEFQERVLAVVRVRYTGTFNTGRKCYCKGEILDIATESPRTAPFARKRLFGPNLSPADQLDRFEVVHRYVCKRCSFAYDVEHFEKNLGYLPKEQISPIPRSDEVNESVLFLNVA